MIIHVLPAFHVVVYSGASLVNELLAASETKTTKQLLRRRVA